MIADTGIFSCSPLGRSETTLPADADRTALLARLLSNPMLPSPPPIALRIVEIVSNPSCDVQEISKCLSKDPALCAKLLRALNSCVYALSHPVTSIERAVSILGIHPLRSLVLGLTLPAMQTRTETDRGWKQFWMDSVSGAIIARELAKRTRRLSPEDILVASLVRDLGMILLKQSFPTTYESAWFGRGAVWGEQQCEWEEQQLGIHHAEVSAGLLQRWRLPDEIVSPVRYHHHLQQMRAISGDVVERAHLLDFSSRLARLNDFHDCPAQMQDLLQMARRFALSTGSLEQFLKDVRPQIEEFATILQVDIGACPNFAEVLASGCEALVQLSMQGGIPAQRGQKAHSKSSLSDNGLNPSAMNIPNFASHERSSDYSLQFTEDLGKPSGRVVIQNFEILEVIGRGGMGVVLKARDLSLNRIVALKMLLPEIVRSERDRQRFAREARTAASIVHENVMSIHSVSEWKGVSFLVMEYIPGNSLQELLDSGRTFSVPEIVRIGRQCALGLAAAHNMRVIHRDIKPENVLLERATKRVRITDFGLAREIDDICNITQEGALTGTPSFMSPEQVKSKPLNHLTDLFSLGSLLYVLCTGKLPFSSATLVSTLYSILETTPVPIPELNPAIPPGLVRIIEALHGKDPESRIQSGAIVAEQLALLEMQRN